MGGGENRARGDDFQSPPKNHSTMMMPRDSAQPTCQKLTMSLFWTSQAVDPWMIATPFLHRHPLLSMFHQKLPCKIHLHRPMTLALQSHLTINPAPTQMNPHPSPKETALDSISDDVDGSSLGVVKRLLQKSYLSQVWDGVLYIYNWYTTVKFAKWLFNELGWRFCGTMVP